MSIAKEECTKMKVEQLASTLDISAVAIATAEMSRVDASCSTFILVHSSLAMLTIGTIYKSFLHVYLFFSCSWILKYYTDA